MPRGGKRAGAGRPRKPRPPSEGLIPRGYATERPTADQARAAASEGPASAGTVAIGGSGEAVSLGQAIGRAKDLTLRLLAELDAVTTRIGEIEELIELETAGDRDMRRRNAMLKAVSTGSRAATLRSLLASSRAWAELEARARGAQASQASDEAQKPEKDGWDFVDDAPAATKSVN